MTTPFFVHKTAATVEEAFAAAQADGGPITLKTAYTVYPPPVNANPDALARAKVDQDWHHIAETEFPAACWALPNNDYFFFGAA